MNENDEAGVIGNVTPAVSIPTRRKWSRPLLVVGAAAITLAGWNAIVAVPAMRALTNEKNASVLVYRRWLIMPRQIVFDVRTVTPEVTMVDIDRMLFDTAEALKDGNFGEVVLAARGRPRLVLDGAQFKLIGEERRYQNPMHVITTLQQHVSNLDGQPAFGTWTGGWLGGVDKLVDARLGG